MRTGRHGPRAIVGRGSGPIEAFVEALRREFAVDFAVNDYHEHAVGSGADATAVAYVEVGLGETAWFGVGRDRSITTASLRAVLGGLNRALREREHVAVAV